MVPMGEANFYTPPASELLSHATSNFERMMTSVRGLSELVGIGFTGAVPHVGGV